MVLIDGNDPHARVPAAAAASPKLLDRIARNAVVVLTASNAVSLLLLLRWGTSDCARSVLALLNTRSFKSSIREVVNKPLTGLV